MQATVETAIEETDQRAGAAELEYLSSVGVVATTKTAPDVPLVWFISERSVSASDHLQRLTDAFGAGRAIITASLDGAQAPALPEVTEPGGANTRIPPAHLDLSELGGRTFRERLLWHIDDRRNTLANAGGISRATRVTRWMLIGLGIFFIILFGSLFHMSYHQI